MHCILHCIFFSDKQTPKALDSPCHAILLYIFFTKWNILIENRDLIYPSIFKNIIQIFKRRRGRPSSSSSFVVVVCSGGSSSSSKKLCLLTIPILFLCHITLQRNAHKTHYYYVTCLIYLCTNSQSQKRKKATKTKRRTTRTTTCTAKKPSFSLSSFEAHSLRFSFSEEFQAKSNNFFRPFSLYTNNFIIKIYACM